MKKIVGILHGWIVVDNVAWALEVFFQAYFKEVGLMKIAGAYGF
jgi:hypothetical protein